MADGLVSVRQIHGAIGKLDEEITSVREQLDMLSQKISELEAKRARFLTALEAVSELSPSSAASSSTSGRSPNNLPERQPYGLWTAAVKTCIEIIQDTGKPWLTRDLLAELRDRGFVFTVADPTTNLSNKLGRAERLRSDSNLGWHLSEWPKPDKVELSVEERLNLLRSVHAHKSAAPRNATPNPASNVVELVPFYGQGLPETATAFVKNAGVPMGNVAITDTLTKAGYPFHQKDRENAVETALRRRSNSEGDVVRVAAGTWGMKEWYSEEELRQFANSLGGVPGRDAQAHLEKTRQAVQAHKARGVRFGTRPMLDDEGMAKVREKIASGTSPKEIAASLGVSIVTIHRWIKKWTEAELDLASQEPSASNPQQ